MVVDPTEAGVYAKAGAAALVAGITHTISPVVIVIEITAQASNMLPMLVTTVVSYAVAGTWWSPRKGLGWWDPLGRTT